MCHFYAFSTDSSKEEDGSVTCCSRSWEKGWLVSFFLNLPDSPRNFLSAACLNERHGTQRTNQDLVSCPLCLQRCGPTVSIQCYFQLQTFSASARLALPPVLHSSRFALTLFMESRGAGVWGVTKDEALKSRKSNIRKSQRKLVTGAMSRV